MNVCDGEFDVVSYEYDKPTFFCMWFVCNEQRIMLDVG